VASLKVSFCGPFYGAYHVIALDLDRYDAALVSGPTRGYLWLLARERSLDPERREALIASASGFDVDQLIWVAQTRDDPELHR
jgi:apolipoprotein D and lipocalin family protein